MKKFVAVICTIVVLALIPFSIFVIEQTKAKKENDNHTDIDIVSAAQNSANSYNISQKSEQIEVELENILATKEFIFVWISANGIPGNALYDYLDDCIITDQKTNVWKYSLQEKEISTYGKYSIKKPKTDATGLKENELIIKFITGINSDSIVQITFDFGEKGLVTFDDIDVKSANSTVYKLENDVSSEFDLPYAHCKILEVEYTPLGVFFTIRWELEVGFTASTKSDYPKYHTKFTFGEASRFTFLLLPEYWSSDDTVIISTYYLDELIPQNEPIVIDLYLNDDQTFEKNLALIET